MEPKEYDWFRPWYGKSVDQVEREFRLEEMYEEYRIVPDTVIITMDYRPNRVTIWYDMNTKLVTLITSG